MIRILKIIAFPFIFLAIFLLHLGVFIVLAVGALCDRMMGKPYLHKMPGAPKPEDY